MSFFNFYVIFVVGLSSPILSDSQFSVLNRSLSGRESSMDEDLAQLEVDEIDFFDTHIPVINAFVYEYMVIIVYFFVLH